MSLQRRLAPQLLHRRRHLPHPKSKASGGQRAAPLYPGPVPRIKLPSTSLFVNSANTVRHTIASTNTPCRLSSGDTRFSQSRVPLHHQSPYPATDHRPLAPAAAGPKDLRGPDSPPARGIFVLSAQTLAHKAAGSAQPGTKSALSLLAGATPGDKGPRPGSLRARAGSPSPPYRTSPRGARLWEAGVAASVAGS
ncbi:hypothetical protein NN561_018267 [Cricetulus griseus]